MALNSGGCSSSSLIFDSTAIWIPYPLDSTSWQQPTILNSQEILLKLTIKFSNNWNMLDFLYNLWMPWNKITRRTWNLGFYFHKNEIGTVFNKNRKIKMTHDFLFASASMIPYSLSSVVSSKVMVLWLGWEIYLAEFNFSSMK